MHRLVPGLLLAAQLVTAPPCFANQIVSTESDDWSDVGHEQQEPEPQYRRFYASVGFGFDFSTGDYGEPEDTDYWSFPAFAKLEYDPVTLKVSIPYSVIDGADEFVVGDNDVVSATGSSTRHGFGDIVTSLTYSWYPEEEILPIVDLRVKAKIPTASEGDDIGTGETDITLGFELAESFGPITAFGGASYRFKGGRPDDIWLATVGANVRFAKLIPGLPAARRLSIGTAYDYRQSSSDFAEDSHEVAVFSSYRFDSHRRLSPYAVFGLSENAPDWGLGATFTYQF
jgi:hypothetical protein